jgi:hypothetical protein
MHEKIFSALVLVIFFIFSSVGCSDDEATETVNANNSAVDSTGTDSQSFNSLIKIISAPSNDEQAIIDGNCSNNGILIYSGQDTNNNNILDENEQTNEPLIICHGTDANNSTNNSSSYDINISLIRTEVISESSTCSNNAMLIHFGTDLNYNNYLEESEIINTETICLKTDENISDADIIPPNLVKVDFDGIKLNITFDEEINPDSVNLNNIIFENSKNEKQLVGFTSDDNIHFTSSAISPINGIYSLKITTGIQDLAGNNLLEEFNSQFEDNLKKFEWLKSFSQAYTDQEAFFSIADDDGYIYISGSNKIEISDNYQILLSKHSYDGNQTWRKVIQHQNAKPYSMSFNSDKSQIYLAGYIKNSDNYYNLWFSKYDTNGNEYFFHQDETNLTTEQVSDQSVNIQIDEENNIYIFHHNRYLIKYNADLDKFWEKNIDYFDENNSANISLNNKTLKSDNNGNLYLIISSEADTDWYKVGESSDLSTNTSTSITHRYLTNTVFNDSSINETILLKYDTNGNQIWLKNIKNKIATSLDLDLENNSIYVGGYQKVDNNIYSDYEQGWLSKFDSDGNEIWNTNTDLIFENSGNRVTSIAVKDSAVYLNGASNYLGKLENNSNNLDMWFAKYNSSGQNIQFYEFIENSSNEIFELGHLVINSNNDVFAIGTHINASDNNDFYIAKFGNQEDLIPPVVENIEILENYQVQITFSERINTDSFFNAVDIYLNNENITNELNIYTENGQIFYTESLQNNGDYEIEISSDLQDTNKNSLTENENNSVTLNPNFPVEEEWLTKISGGYSESLTFINLDNSENFIYATGYTNSDLNGSKTGDDRDILLMKYDLNGTQIWLKQFGTSDDDATNSMAIDSQNNIYLAVQSGSIRDIWLAKYDLNGEQLWKQNFVGNSNLDDFVNQIILDEQNNIYFTGYANSNSFVAKYNGTTGGQLWSKELNNSDYAYSLALDNTNDIYLTGDNNLTGAWVSKLNNINGELLWKTDINNSKILESNYINIDSQNNIYLTGQIENNDSKDIWLAKYNSNGEQVWWQEFGGSADDFSKRIAIDSNQDIYLTGNTHSNLKVKSIANNDVWVAKYNFNGEQLWLKQFNYEQEYFSNSITIDEDKNIYLGGYFDDNIWLAEYQQLAVSASNLQIESINVENSKVKLKFSKAINNNILDENALKLYFEDEDRYIENMSFVSIDYINFYSVILTQEGNYTVELNSSSEIFSNLINFDNFNNFRVIYTESPEVSLFEINTNKLKIVFNETMNADTINSDSIIVINSNNQIETFDFTTEDNITFWSVQDLSTQGNYEIILKNTILNSENIAIETVELPTLYLEDTVQPTLESLTLDGTQIRIIFSEEIDPATVNSTNILLLDENLSQIPDEVLIFTTEDNVTFYSSALSSTGNYVIQIKQNIQDINGNNLDRDYTISDLNYVKSGQFLDETSSFSRNDESNVITDNITTLKWEDTEHSQSTKLNYEDASAYCENLTLNNITNWRVPTFKELWYLHDFDLENPALNSIFNNFQNSWYWSSTPDVAEESKQWSISIDTGFSYTNYNSNLYNIRCVSGVSYYENMNFSYTNSTQNMIMDPRHNLMWQNTQNVENYNFTIAEAYCENLSLEGFDDWRLPTVEELFTITDHTKSNPAVNNAFTQIEDDTYWTSTDDASNISQKLTIVFNKGYNYSESDVNTKEHKVICVREY